jgi:hypothetical protein
MTESPATSPSPEAVKPPAEWKPEPRQWTWKDLFTAPMLAFKPKCMAVSALTLIVLGLWAHLFGVLEPNLGSWFWPVAIGFILVTLVLFGLGATLVAVFMKADLLDDEFLSFGEALGQFKSRIVAAMLVPVFLAVLVAAVHGLLVWFPMFIGSIPYAGGAIYALLYPLGFFAAIFAILLAIAVVFSIFVFPAIVAVRKHGWFDNVVDTIEAVGTRPHILVASLALTGVFMWFAFVLCTSAGGYLRTVSGMQPTWGAESGRSDTSRVEDRAQEISVRAISWVVNPTAVGTAIVGMNPNMLNQPLLGFGEPSQRSFFGLRQETEPFYRWGSGLIAGFWQTVIGALVLGYCLNLFIGGGMLTYLVVREDDYWDDEDLEDLDKLAKELEDEAKSEEAGKPAAATPAANPAPAPVPAPAPAPAPASIPAANPGPAGDGTLPTQMIPPKG